MKRFRVKKTLLAAIAASAALTVPALAGPPNENAHNNSTRLRVHVNANGIRFHQFALQAIATFNNNTRASSTPGYEASARYVYTLLKAAGYEVSYQPFDYPYYEEAAPPVMQQVAPTPHDYVNGTDFVAMEYAATGDVTAQVQAVDLMLPPTGGSTSGCEAADFAGFTAGNIALVQRGSCDFIVKVQNAIAAGASGVVIFNEGNSPDREGLLNTGTLGNPVTIPVLATSFALGKSLNDQIASGLRLHMKTSTISEIRSTRNVIADTRGGDPNSVVVVGAHLDSVSEGPGINDNGSGTAMNLEIALKMAKLHIKPRNKVRFAFWGAEESGLRGSNHYVASLSEEELAKIQLNLNFDMVGSPNFVRFVYDGDGSSIPGAGPDGSGEIEKVFNDHFASQGLQTEPTAFDGRSDYRAFILAGIPAGGLFTGAEKLKTPEQAAVYGGTAGQPYDPCYHQRCDDFRNVSETALSQMSDAAAHAVYTFAMRSEPLRAPAAAALAEDAAGKGKGKGKGKDSAMPFKGPRQVR